MTCDHCKSQIARAICAETGFCPFGGDASDAKMVVKTVGYGAGRIKPVEKRASIQRNGTGKPPKKWTETYQEMLQIKPTEKS